MDTISKEHRSWNMSRIKSKDTKPEIYIRKALHRLGYRFRLHRKDLPGCPDIILPKHKTVIFVHGCYWHRHENCKYAYTPNARRLFWVKKFSENVRRDKGNLEALRTMGWQVIVVWECEIKDEQKLHYRLISEIGRTQRLANDRSPNTPNDI